MSQPKKILITGTSSGFGLGATKALAQKGHTVFATMRGTNDKNAESARALRHWAEENRAAVQVLELDVTKDDSVKAAVETVVTKAGAIDVLVNNAGIGTWGLQEAFAPEQVQAMFDVNVLGVLRLNRAVLPHMRKAGDGYVIYVSSGLGRIVLPFLGPYTASKFALEALAETAAYELAPLGISTTILQPGAFGTNFHGNAIPPLDATLLDGIPAVKARFEGYVRGFEARAKAGHLGDPTEIFQAIVDLVESEKGKRPLRKTVGAEIQGSVSAINDTCAQVQNQLMTFMGLR
jgi:NAD(P)-dependent dehydrogenase (short-subunit alcohol dehydrogenase family)